VLTTAALVHAKWVEIHPFANGNGRTARLWANWVPMRYGVPPFVRLRPRPEGLPYATASRQALCEGDHEPTIRLIFRLFDEFTAE
jgi:Fic family protein